MKGKRIGLLKGGLSAEREVSLRTGAACALALRSIGYEIVEIDAGRDLGKHLESEAIEVVFNALHGRYGEDGCVQGLLELMQIPYTGSGVAASAMAMHKPSSKRLFHEAGLNTPPFQIANGPEGHGDCPLPAVVKPASEGSSVGVTIVHHERALKSAIEEAAKYGGGVIIESFIAGREINVAVLDDQALGAIEIMPARPFYDYVAKYDDSKTKYGYPAEIDSAVLEKTCEVALQAHRLLGCRGASRSDFIITEEGIPYLLELNTLPGMTASSLLPKIALQKGIDFEELCVRLLKQARLGA